MERRFLQQKAATVTLETRDGESPQIVGYAAVHYDGTRDTEYELWPGVRERIMPGTFDRAVKERDDARALYNHDPDNLLGRVSSDTLTLSTDDTGLRYEIDPPGTQLARDVTTLVERGDLTGSSFAFLVTDEDWRKEDGEEIREIRGVQLFDVGPVTYPAYEATTVGTHSQLDKSEARTSYANWKARDLQDRLRTRVVNAKIDARLSDIS